MTNNQNKNRQNIDYDKDFDYGDPPAPSRKKKPSKAARAHGRRRKAVVAKNMRGPWQRFARTLFLILDILVGICMFLSGYAGMFSPLQYSPLWGVLLLCFPFAFWTAVILFVVQLFWHRRGILVLALAFVASWGPVTTYFPLNVHIGARKPAEGNSTFRLLTYNTANLLDQRPVEDRGDTTCNAMIEYIIQSKADVVCLQEAEKIGVFKKGNITREQFGTLNAIYPHIIISGKAQVILSKFPVESIHLLLVKNDFSNADLGAYRLTMPNGQKVALFNVHLQSIGLNASDKSLYHDLTELKTDDLRGAKSQLISKLANANERRARQAQQLLRFIRHYGGPDVIVCGDFNDVSGCFAIRTLEDAKFKDVYPQIGFGPMITFNANRFYFCIDHVLYRGDLKPLSIKKGSTKASDHYPLTVDFELTGD